MSETAIPYRHAYAFLIGVGRYDPPADGSKALQGYAQIHANLDRLDTLLRSSLIVDQPRVERIPDPENLGEILNRMRDTLPQTLPESDVLIVLYYAGHASKKDGSLRLSLRTACERTQTQPDRSFTVEDLLGPLERTYQRQRILLVLDCCYSGQALDDLRLSGWPGLGVLFASQAGERAQVYVAGAHSPYTAFTAALITTLEQGRGEQRFLTMRTLSDGIEQHLSPNTHQRPWMLAPAQDHLPLFTNRATSRTATNWGKLPASELFVIDCDRVEERNRLLDLIRKPAPVPGPRVVVLDSTQPDRPVEFLRSTFNMLNSKYSLVCSPYSRLIGIDTPPYIDLDGLGQALLLDELGHFLGHRPVSDSAGLLSALADRPLIATPLLMRRNTPATRDLLAWYIDTFWGRQAGVDRVLIPVIRLKTAPSRWRRWEQPLLPRNLRGLSMQLALGPFAKTEILLFLQNNGFAGMARLIERHQPFQALPSHISMQQAEELLLDVFHQCRPSKP